MASTTETSRTRHRGISVGDELGLNCRDRPPLSGRAHQMSCLYCPNLIQSRVRVSVRCVLKTIFSRKHSVRMTTHGTAQAHFPPYGRHSDRFKTNMMARECEILAHELVATFTFTMEIKMTLHISLAFYSA